MTLSDFEKRNTMGQIFLADLHNYVRMVWPTMTKFGMGKRVSMGSATPHHKGGVPSVPKILGPPKCAHKAWETATEFCMVIKLDVREILTTCQCTVTTTIYWYFRYHCGWTSKTKILSILRSRLSANTVESVELLKWGDECGTPLTFILAANCKLVCDV